MQKKLKLREHTLKHGQGCLHGYITLSSYESNMRSNLKLEELL